MSTSSRAAVRFAVEGQVGIITIDRPEVHNAVNREVAIGIENSIDRLEDDPNLRVGILTATPPTFCAGADLKEFVNGGRRRTHTPRGGFAGIAERARTKPILAAVDGPALAGGTEVCLACDLIIASRNAYFELCEVKRGLVAASGGLVRLPQRIPFCVAMEMALTGNSVTAETAYGLGLVNRLTDPNHALEEALGLARQISSNAPLAVRASRRVLLAGLDTKGPAWKLAEQLSAEMLATEDAKEGVTAFLQKRPPTWLGR